MSLHSWFNFTARSSHDTDFRLLARGEPARSSGLPPGSAGDAARRSSVRCQPGPPAGRPEDCSGGPLRRRRPTYAQAIAPIPSFVMLHFTPSVSLWQLFVPHDRRPEDDLTHIKLINLKISVRYYMKYFTETSFNQYVILFYLAS